MYIYDTEWRGRWASVFFFPLSVNGVGVAGSDLSDTCTGTHEGLLEGMPRGHASTSFRKIVIHKLFSLREK